MVMIILKLIMFVPRVEEKEQELAVELATGREGLCDELPTGG
jgi:hypothetical protein